MRKDHMAYIHSNSNFHSATKKTVFDAYTDQRFLEYRMRWDQYPSQFIVGGFPLHLDIESTNVCNLRCPFCATTFDKWGSNKRGFMDMRLFKEIIDEGSEKGLYSIKLSLRGEPLLHPDIGEMISYARKKGIIDIYFNTNATMLTEDIASKLIKSGLVRISISVEGATKEVYESYRVGARFEDVVENVKRLRRMRDQEKVCFPQIRIQTVLLDALKESFPSYVAFWRTIADEVSYLDARHEGSREPHIPEKAEWACPFLWQRMVVLWDGTILPCLMHGVPDFSLMALGNFDKMSIEEAWNSEPVRHYREIHRSGQTHTIKGCAECSYRAMEVEKLARIAGKTAEGRE